MKVMMCGKCMDVRGMPSNGEWVKCECGNVEARWSDPISGRVRLKAKDRKWARVIGLNNEFLLNEFRFGAEFSDEQWRKLHKDSEADALGYVFHTNKRDCWACVIQVGETSDISWEEENEKDEEELESSHG
jgi:hypothetical protein